MESILLTIKQARPSLTKTERTIADYIFEHREDTLNKSVQILAKEVSTSPASVVRFSQKFCGTGGFSALKLALSAESNNESQLYQEISPTDSFEQIQEKLSLRINQSVEKTNQSLNSIAIEQATEMIEDSNCILAFGLGASRLAAEDLQQKFLRVGQQVIVPNDPHLAITYLLNQPPNTTVILFSNSGQTDDLVQIAKAIEQLDINVIVVTQNNESQLAKLADLVLRTEASSEDFQNRTSATTSLISQLLTVDLLYYSFFSKHYNQNIKKVTDSQQYIQSHFRRV